MLDADKKRRYVRILEMNAQQGCHGNLGNNQARGCELPASTGYPAG
jgi:hypothetical protein